jgi:hypothetical protein
LMHAILAHASQGHICPDADSAIGHAVWLPPGPSRLVAGCLDPATAANVRRRAGAGGQHGMCGGEGRAG